MFSLEPSEEQKMLQETARSFAAEQLRPIAHACDENGDIPLSVLEQAWGLGLVSSALPEACGGAGFERLAVSGALAAEELAWGDLSLALAMLAPALFAYPVLTDGTPEQQQAFLPLVCQKTPPCLSTAIMEPVMSFDPGRMTCRATRRNGAYVLTGRKCFVPQGSQAERFLVFAALEGNSGYDHVAGFIVERSNPGLAVSGRERLMGLNALDTVTLDLQDALVGPEAILGGEQGCDFSRLISYSRTALCALAIGVARAANEYARQYALERTAFGEPIAYRQAISFMIAEDFMEIEAARLLTWEAAWRLDSHLEAFKESYLAKLYTDQVVVKATDDAVQTLGGHGYIREHPAERWLRNGRGFSCFEGLAIV